MSSSGSYPRLSQDQELLWMALSNSSLTKLRTALTKTGPNFRHCDYGYWTPLHQACMYGRHDVVLILIAAGADIRAQDIEGCSPLHLASGMFGNKALGELLLSQLPKVASCFRGEEIVFSDNVPNNDGKVAGFNISTGSLDLYFRYELTHSSPPILPPWDAAAIRTSIDNERASLDALRLVHSS